MDAKKILNKKPGCIIIEFITFKSLKNMKNNIAANGNANANLTYVDATVEISLFNFFCNDDLRF